MFEKRPLESKKFVAYLVANVIWGCLIVASILTMKDVAGFSTTLLAMVICLGFVQVLYIGGQAAVDTFVRIGMAFANRTTDLSPLPDDQEEEPL